MTFDEELTKAVGEPLFNYLVNTFDVYKDTLEIGMYFARNPDLTTVERLAYIIGLYERYIRAVIDLLPLFPKSEQLEILRATHRLDIKYFAKYFVHAATQEELDICEKKVKDVYKKDDILLDGLAKYFDAVVFLRLLEQSQSTKYLESQKTNAIKRFLSEKMHYSPGDLTIVECEKAVKQYFEEKHVRNVQKIVRDFKDQTYEWNIVRKIPEVKFINWLISKELEIQKEEKNIGFSSATQSQHHLTEGILTLVYQDNTGERKYIGKASSKALDAGLFQAIRPSEIIRQFGIILKSIEFTITDQSFPPWIYLNHLTQDQAENPNIPIQESSIFAIIGKEPNIRQLDGIHSLIHRILIGKERRLPGSDDSLVKDTVFRMLDEVLIKEKSQAQKLFEEKEIFATDTSLHSTRFEPHFLLNFKLEKQRHRLGWDTIEGWAKNEITRQTISLSGYPWILDSTNRFKDVLVDLFSRRLKGEVFMKKSAFMLDNNLYFTISDVNPETLRARIVVFKSDPEGKLNFVDIRRRFDLFVTQTPEKFGFKKIFDEMNAKDVQLVLDKLSFT